MCDSGILYIAHGKKRYLIEAIASAASVKRYSPNVNIALATDLALPSRYTHLFRYVRKYDFTDKKGVISKCWLDRMSPYRDVTLFLDTDTIAFGPIDSFLDSPPNGFSAFGKMAISADHWFRTRVHQHALLGKNQLALFCGGAYKFDRSPQSAAVFEKARQILAQYDRLGLLGIAPNNQPNEEPVFSVALHSLNIPVTNEETGPVRTVTKEDLQQISWVAKTNSLLSKGSTNDQPIWHFHSFRNRYPYQLLQTRALQNAKGSDADKSVLSHFVASSKQVAIWMERLHRKIKRMP